MQEYSPENNSSLDNNYPDNLADLTREVFELTTKINSRKYRLDEKMEKETDQEARDLAKDIARLFINPGEPDIHGVAEWQIKLDTLRSMADDITEQDNYLKFKKLERK